MALDIIEYYWEFGDGFYSSSQSPYHIYRHPGKYTVSLSITNSDGVLKKKTKNLYIEIVSEVGHIPGFSEKASRTCIHLGVDSEDGGWGFYGGEGWLYPESSAAIFPVAIGDKLFEVVFDSASGIPFVINTSGSSGNAHIDEVFKDKVNHPNDKFGVDIKTSLTTKLYIGEDRRFRVKHEETYFNVSPVRDRRSIDENLQIDVHLLDGDSSFHVEKIRDINIGEEILFTTKKLADGCQVRIDTNMADFKISDVGTSIKVDSKARYVTKVLSPDKSFQEFMSSATSWYTRGSYNRNLYDGQYRGFDADRSTMIEGPDGFPESAITYTGAFDLLLGTWASVLLWTDDPEQLSYTHSVGVPVDYETLFEYGIWKLVLVRNVTNDGILRLGASSYFDIRVFPTELTDITWFKQYFEDVTTQQGHKYIGRYYG